MCKTTVAPSDGLWTTLNNVVYIVIYVTAYRIGLMKFRFNIQLQFITSVQMGVEIRHAGILCRFFSFSKRRRQVHFRRCKQDAPT